MRLEFCPANVSFFRHSISGPFFGVLLLAVRVRAKFNLSKGQGGGSPRGRDRQSSNHQAFLPEVLPRFRLEDPTTHNNSGDSTTVSLAWAKLKDSTSLESPVIHHSAGFSCSSIRSWSPYIRATKMLKYSCKFLVSRKFCRTNSFAMRPISRALSG